MRFESMLGVCSALVVCLASPAHAAPSKANNVKATESLYRAAVNDARAGRSAEALPVLKKLVQQYPQRMDYLADYALVLSWAGNHAEALAAYQKVLAQEPGNRAAMQGKIRALARLGAPQLALDLADRNPGLLSAADREVIAADATAHKIRWGAIAADTGIGSARFAETDRALADSEAAAARALNPKAELSSVDRTLAQDRVVALRDRYQMREATSLYEALAARPEAMPAYVKSAAASAYLYLEQPEKSRDIYREALSAEPENLEARLGLFYALAECEQHDAALIEVDKAVAATPKWIDAWSPATIHENPAYARALSARAMAPLLANRVGESEQRLHELAEQAPFNMGIRTDYASSMRARGWPRAAEKETRWILATEPNNSGALGERAGALLEMRDYHNAEAALAAAQAVTPEDGRVKRAARLASVHDMRELIVESSLGRSGGGGPVGTKDQAIEGWLYSSPFNYNYRAFAHVYSARAVFDNGTGKRDRAGVGLEYRSPLYIATGELSQDLSTNNTGAAGSFAYTPNDFWTLRASADTSSNETPLQARLAGINARRVAAEAIWRANESRSAAASLAYMDFSDGNRREIAQARWTERVIVGPVYKLEITGGLYASRNSATATPYFNPSRDFSPTIEFANEWTQWRRYTRSFKHRLIVAAGSYSQQGFGSGSVTDARYEQEWAADDRLVLRYGIGRSERPYDGVQTARNYGYLSMNWRF